MSTTSPLAAQSEKPKLLAPLWHTIVLILFVFATAYFQSHNRIENHNDHPPSRPLLVHDLL